MKKTSLILTFSLFSILVFSQDTLTDSLNNIKSFSTLDMGIYLQNAKYNHVQFGDYTLDEGVYSPTIHSALFWNSVVAMKDQPLFLTKAGLLFNSYSTNLSDKQGNNYYLSQAELALSFMIGTHLPVKYNDIRDKFFKSVNLNLGLYMGTPWYEYFAHSEDKYKGQSQYFKFDYMKFGVVADIEYSMINESGYGHRIGLRTMIDFNSIWKFKNNETGIYPCFASVGVYYNFWTSDVTKRN